jgi:hypothetical protein
MGYTLELRFTRCARPFPIVERRVTTSMMPVAKDSQARVQATAHRLEVQWGAPGQAVRDRPGLRAPAAEALAAAIRDAALRVRVMSP